METKLNSFVFGMPLLSLTWIQKLGSLFNKLQGVNLPPKHIPSTSSIAPEAKRPRIADDSYVEEEMDRQIKDHFIGMWSMCT